MPIKKRKVPPPCFACSKTPCSSCSKRFVADRLYDTAACNSCTSTRIQYKRHTRLKPILKTCTTCGLQETKGLTEVRKSKFAKVSFPKQTDPGDVSFVVNGNPCVQAHRSVLAGTEACMSPVFKTMLEIEMKENLSGVIKIEDSSAAVVRAAINFMYTGEIEFGDDVCAKEVIKFADLYQITGLTGICEFELGMNINSENIAELLAISYQFGAENLKAIATKYFSANWTTHRAIVDSAFADSQNAIDGPDKFVGGK